MIDALVAWDVAQLNALRTAFSPFFAEHQIILAILADGEVVAFCALLFFWWLYAAYHHKNFLKERFLKAFYVVMLAFVVYLLINQLFPVRPRPESVSTVAPLIAHLPDNSFPSGHAIFTGASVLAVGAFISPGLGVLFAMLGGMMCLARIIAGVHYPLDIIAGLILGLLLGSFMTWILIIYRRHPTVKALVTAPIRIASYFKL